MVGNEDFLQILKKKYLKKKLSSMQRVKDPSGQGLHCSQIFYAYGNKSVQF